MRLSAASLVLLTLIAACATPAQRIAATLRDHGVPAREAECMGGKLSSRLSYGQLRRLNDITRANADRLGRITVGDLVRLLSAPGDAAIGAEVLRAGLGCAL